MKKEDILEDYSISLISRECSLMGRREVLTGKAKFGIFGDGKDVLFKTEISEVVITAIKRL